MKSFSPDQLSLFADALEDLIALHLGPEVIYVLVLRQNNYTNCLSNAPPGSAEQLRAAFAELSTRSQKPLP